MYKDVEGRSVKLEALGNIDKDYVQTLDFIWQAMKERPKRHQAIILVLLITDPSYSQ